MKAKARILGHGVHPVLIVFPLGLLGGSVAFAVLFVGIGVDFGIQYSVRYREERHANSDLGAALCAAAAEAGKPLALAAAATAAGFYAFVPTDYHGVSELGLIAGTGMLTYTPVANITGSALISVTVDDNGPNPHTVTRTFSVTVSGQQVERNVLVGQEVRADQQNVMVGVDPGQHLC